MAPLKFISLSVGSLLLLQGAYAQTNESSEDKTGDCVKLLNKARTEVGLPEFTTISEDKKYLTKTGSKEQYLPKICEVVKENKPIVISGDGQSFTGATAAYSRTNHECSTAVDEWKKGFSAFKNDNNTLPAAFEVTDSKASGTAKFLSGKAPYNALDAVNFVALYSGKADATAECALVNCAANTGQADNAMVCMTYPAALVSAEPPYNDKQWQGILNVFAPAASSASAAVPTVLALAAAAVGVALM